MAEKAAGADRQIEYIRSALNLKTFPVGIKFLPENVRLFDQKGVRRPAEKSLFCQVITTARTFKWTIGITAEDLAIPICANVLGLSDLPEQVRDGTLRSWVWCGTKEDGKKFEDSIPRVEQGRYKAVLVTPRPGDFTFGADLVLFYGNPGQIILIINALQFEDYETFSFYCVGETSCADSIVRCFLSGKPALGLPCFGERRYGHAQDDELVIALPPKFIEKAGRNLEELYKRGVRYPIPYWGSQTSAFPGLPAAYQDLFQRKE